MAEMSNPVDVMGRELPYSQEAELAQVSPGERNILILMKQRGR